ncbi:hypothetical protein AB0B89_34535 [Sphaerisporangium sp. NPDC049002]|uniref:hypothetical protein n=1 Tax=unclassified Sphaerisporangium TaxID=2630420 RepID=UPI0033D9BAE6
MREAISMALSPLKVDPEIDQLISNGAHFLGVTKKDLVAEAVRVYLEIRREEIRQKMLSAMAQLDGSNRSRLAMLTGLSPERIDELGGVREDD